MMLARNFYFEHLYEESGFEITTSGITESLNYIIPNSKSQWMVLYCHMTLCDLVSQELRVGDGPKPTLHVP
jgi:hypothetical protein